MNKIITMIAAAVIAVAFAVPVTFGADKAPVVEHSHHAAKVKHHAPAKKHHKHVHHAKKHAKHA
jgi:hypothetical protein